MFGTMGQRQGERETHVLLVDVGEEDTVFAILLHVVRIVPVLGLHQTAHIQNSE